MNKMLLFLLAVASSVAAQRQATVTETVEPLPTYPFSDPDPVADPSSIYYPYFRFDGFAVGSIEKDWKVVTLENDYIRLTLYPEIGGKIGGAVDKTSGKEFIYRNQVVKFRDIAMRGPWTSGGIEFNFGIIGHAPTSSTPVDYLTRKKADGSVSCYLSSYDLLTRTLWTVEVNLPPEKAYFTTKTTWHNASSVDQPYYQWMNAGYPAAGNAEFCYPGTNYIGHGGGSHPFPLDEQGRDLSWYENNNFGPSKSYHIVGKYNDFYGIYWHAHDFGSIHHAAYDEKLGMKIFLWGLSREGGIWEDLLTDTDGQYVELQSGRMYIQPASGSAFTPYKHTAFGAQATDQWTEYWFPVKHIRGVVKASRIGALNVLREDGFLKLYFSPSQKLSTTVRLYDGDKKVYSAAFDRNVLEAWKDSIPLSQAVPAGRLKVVVGDDLLVYSEVPSENLTNRPKQSPADFDWESAYGLYTQGEQWMNQKMYDKAEKYLCAALEKEAYFLPALTALASLHYRRGHYEEALAYCRTALSLNTYQGEANYLYGLCNRALGKRTDAKDGFSVASYAPSVRSAAYEKLAEMCLLDRNWNQAEHYACKSLEFNRQNLTAQQVLMVVYRLTGRTARSEALISSLLEELPLFHAARFEYYLLNGTDKKKFESLIRSEFPFETYRELAEWYESVGREEEALALLSFASDDPIANYKAAWLLHTQGKEAAGRERVAKANSQSPAFVFPFRPSTLKALEWAKSVGPDWKIGYYEGLIYWANQDKEKALALFHACGETGYAPFYLSRALLKEGEARLADLLKAEETGKSWRTGFALINYYTARKQWPEAVETGRKYRKMYPSNYYIGLKYAKALCETGRYEACVSVLNRMQVLPNEGAYAGRAVYRAAHLYRAMEQLKRKKYKQVLLSTQASEEWPENLGVGKPYDDMIDARLEEYLEAQAQAGLGNKARAEELLSSVAAYRPAHGAFDSGNLLSALALRESGRRSEADRMVASWATAFPDSRIAQWCMAVYKGDRGNASALLRSRNDPADTTPWEASFRDVNFDLLVRLFE